ncbi:hypothetical protein ElyMa_000304200 [Elysia marginata]|uniref:Uncharacterized protein n=1 Tax=Elysia marginata TaxID=1093978 RepID=A0AAV4FAV2_9GAST|nr:hypothetical protein ElyMa_000304200 [Elysia marginata]
MDIPAKQLTHANERMKTQGLRRRVFIHCHPVTVKKKKDIKEQLFHRKRNLHLEVLSQRFSCTMSRCKARDEMFPEAGIPEFKPAHDYPTKYPNFHWWGESEVQTEVCYKSIKRDELPIPPLHDERWRYPYRYSSAVPSIAWKEKRKDTEKAAFPKKTPMEPRDIRQVKGYETVCFYLFFLFLSP